MVPEFSYKNIFGDMTGSLFFLIAAVAYWAVFSYAKDALKIRLSDVSFRPLRWLLRLNRIVMVSILTAAILNLLCRLKPKIAAVIFPAAMIALYILFIVRVIVMVGIYRQIRQKGEFESAWDRLSMARSWRYKTEENYWDFRVISVGTAWVVILTALILTGRVILTHDAAGFAASCPGILSWAIRLAMVLRH